MTVVVWENCVKISVSRYNPVPWSAAECGSHGNEHLYKYNPYGPSMARSGDGDVEVVFEKAITGWNPCRHYSVNATIMNDRGTLINCTDLLSFLRIGSDR